MNCVQHDGPLLIIVEIIELWLILIQITTSALGTQVKSLMSRQELILSQHDKYHKTLHVTEKLSAVYGIRITYEGVQ